MKQIWRVLVALIIASMVLTACGGVLKPTLRFVADENLRTLFEKNPKILSGYDGANIKIDYVPSDLAGFSYGDSAKYAGYITENSITMPKDFDKKDIANTLVSVYMSKSSSERVGWQPGTPHSVGEFKNLLSQKSLTLLTENPSIDNIALSFYFALVSSFKTNPGSTLTINDVLDESIRSQGSQFYSATARSTGTVKEAIDLYVSDKKNGTNELDAVTLSEVMAVELINSSADDGYFYYLTNATMVMTAQIGCNKASESLTDCQSFANYLGDSTVAQEEVAKTAWRPVAYGVNPTNQYLSENHGFMISPEFDYIPMPDQSVVTESVTAYVNYYRLSVNMEMCADRSGSMEQNGGYGRAGLDDAMKKVFGYDGLGWLHQNRIYYSNNDRFEVIFFANQIVEGKVHVGNNAEALKNFATDLVTFESIDKDGTLLYDCAKVGLDKAVAYKRDNPNSRSVLILFTDGKDMYSSITKQDFIEYWKVNGDSIPVISITFGSSAKKEIGYEVFGKFVNGQFYSGDENLPDAFRKAFLNQ